MMYVQARLSPLQIVDGPRELPKAFGNVSGFNHLSDEELARFGWYPCKSRAVPTIDPRTEKLVHRFTHTDGMIEIAPTAEPLSPDEVAQQLAETRREKLSRLASLRWEREVAGIQLGSLRLQTDRSSQAAIAMAAMAGEGERWKAADGRWHDLDPEQVKRAADAVRAYVKACYATEEARQREIKAATTLPELDSIDLEAGWPSRSE